MNKKTKSEQRKSNIFRYFISIKQNFNKTEFYRIVLFNVVLFNVGLGLFMCLNLGLSGYVQASDNNETDTKTSDAETVYVAPSLASKSAQQTRANASRGCASTNQKTKPISLLAPTNHVAQTINTKPSFLVNIPEDTDETWIVTVAQPQTIEPIAELKLSGRKPKGVMPIKIESDLKSNTNYVMTIMILCNPDRPSENSYIRTSFKKVDLSKEDLEYINNESDQKKKSDFLATKGIWYDSVLIAYNLFQETGNSKPFMSLVQSIGAEIN